MNLYMVRRSRKVTTWEATDFEVEAESLGQAAEKAAQEEDGDQQFVAWEREVEGFPDTCELLTGTEMPFFDLKVTQVLRVERECVVRVQAGDLDQAIQMQEESDAPAYDDTCWTDHVDLQNETVEPA